MNLLFIKSIWDNFLIFLSNHKVDPVKEILVPSLGLDKIIALIGLLYVAITFRNSLKLNKFNFILQLTQLHRDLWSRIAEIDGLPEKIKSQSPISALSEKERRHVVHVILHIKLSYEANKAKIFKVDNGTRIDIGQFMNLPIPNSVWNSIKNLHEKKFRNFVAHCKYLADPLHNPKPLTQLQTLFYWIREIIPFILISKKKFHTIVNNRLSSNPSNEIEKQTENDLR